MVENMTLASNSEFKSWVSQLKNDIRSAQIKAAIKVNTELLSLDMRSEFPQSEGFSRANLYHIKRWFAFYSSQMEIVYQAGRQLQKVDNANTPIPDILLCVPWRHQTVICPETVQEVLPF